MDVQTTGILTITIPQDFLDKAVYPITVDPTFGYTSVGASYSNYSSSGQYIFGTLYTLSENGYVSKLTRYDGAYSLNAYFKATIYSESPMTLQETAGDIVELDNTNQWNDLTFTSPIYLTAGNYFIGHVNINPVINWYDSGSTNQQKRADCTASSCYYSPPSTFPVSTGAARMTSIYATYTAGEETATSTRRVIITQ
jgi:hypothetical protein